MTTLGSKISKDSWLDLVDDLTLVVDTLYTIQNTTNNPFKLIEKATEPTDDDPHHIVMPFEMIPVTPATGLGLWAKGINSAANVAVTEG